MKSRIAGYVLAVLSLLIAAENRPSAQDPGSSTIDLSRYYFDSATQEEAARSQLSEALTRLNSFNGNLTSGPQLFAALKANDEVQVLAYKHFAYLRLRCSKGRKDRACVDANQINADVAAKTAFLQKELLAITPQRLAALESVTPELRKYEFSIERVRDAAGHVLDATNQQIVGRLSPALTDWEWPLYSDTTAQIAFGTVETPNGPIDVSRQRNLIVMNTDPRVREEGFRKRLAGYASKRDVFAIALIRTAAAQTALARAYSYSDAPARKYEGLGFAAEETRALLKRMAEDGAVVQQYQKIRSRDIEEQYRVTAGPWDMSAPDPNLTLPRYSLSEARSIFHEVFAALGREYLQEFDTLLTADGGRADILPGGANTRYAGGYSVGFPGTTPALFVGRYDGTFKDLSVIAHEGGHAAHKALMNGNNVLPDYASGPAFLFESFAAFNELLLADYMANRTRDPALRRYYREQWLNIKGLDAFYGAQDALLEQTVYDRVAADKMKGADDLDSVTREVDRSFSIFNDKIPELRSRWATYSLAYEDPLYSVNYLYGGLLALKYFQLWQANPEHFVPQYVGLLKNGFTASPAALLHQYLNIDLNDPHLLDHDIALIKMRLQQLESEK